MIPNGRPAKINMEVGVAASCTHQAVALHLWTHELHIFCRNVRRPVVANPAEFINYSRWHYHLTQSATKFNTKSINFSNIKEVRMFNKKVAFGENSHMAHCT